MKSISCCGSDCTLCGCYGTMCKGCNQSEGIVFHTDGQQCAIYKCMKENSFVDCYECEKKPCDIWRATRDPSYSDEQFEKSILNRIRVLEAKHSGKYIVTPRLVLLPLDVSDASEVFKWCGDKDVTKYMSYSTYSNAEEVSKWIADSGRNCFGFFLRANGQLIGSGDIGINEEGEPELGYNLAKAYWGNGYATEASKGMLAYSVIRGETDFVCKHAQENVRSGRVIEKCGFTYVKDGSYTSFDGLRTFADKEYTLHIDSHEMNVDGEWFDKIANGSKTIELRLNDDKRRSVKVGDYVILRKLGSDVELDACVVKVTALHEFENFNKLYANLDMIKCGYTVNDTPNSDDMLRYYSAERQAEWGVVGIEFELLAITLM